MAEAETPHVTVPIPDAPEPPSLCSDSKEVDTGLRTLGERPVAMGLTGDGEIMVLYRSADGGTWTLSRATTTGLQCYVAAGFFWQTNTEGSF